eukprot:5224627-Pyramimonas_sp.AAC.1
MGRLTRGNLWARHRTRNKVGPRATELKGLNLCAATRAHQNCTKTKNVGYGSRGCESTIYM